MTREAMLDSEGCDLVPNLDLEGSFTIRQFFLEGKYTISGNISHYAIEYDQNWSIT